MFKEINLSQYSIILLIFLLSTASASSQQGTIETITKKQKESRPQYLNIAFGFNVSNFRDLATSPLLYSGKPILTSLSHIDMDEKRESHFTAAYSFGKLSSNFNQHSSQSIVNVFSLNYLELFQLMKTGNSKFNSKIGGQLNSIVYHRENSDLFNNSTGVDIISTLFVSIKATYDFKQTTVKNNKNANRKQTLSSTINVGIVNSSYRNGFAYTSPSSSLNRDDFFLGYEFHVFKGFRMNSAVDYTIFLHNKNAIQFSYMWDTLSTGGNHDNFQVINHTLKFSLLFSLK